MMGSHVTIVQNDPKFLPREEREAAEILSRSMARDDVEIRLNTTVVSARNESGAKILKTVNNAVASDIQADEILLSVGRVPNVEELGRQAAAIEFDTDQGIKVDDFLRSTNPNVYAAGDVCLSRKFTNAAQFSAGMAVQNALMQASELINEMAVIMSAGIGLKALAAVAHTYPTQSQAIMLATQTYRREFDRAGEQAASKVPADEKSGRGWR